MSDAQTTMTTNVNNEVQPPPPPPPTPPPSPPPQLVLDAIASVRTSLCEALAINSAITHFTLVLADDAISRDDYVVLEAHKAVIIEGITSSVPKLRHSHSVSRPYGVEVVPFVPGVKWSLVAVAGRYLKHSRTLSQSPWFLPDGTRIGDYSLQEIVAEPVLKLCFPEGAKRRRCHTEFKASGRHHNPHREDDIEVCTFSSAGREDIDVRMLGDGRPFMLSICGARRIPLQSELDRIAQSFADDPSTPVGLTSLKVVDATYTAKLLEGEEKKKKCYRCVVWSKRTISNTDPLVMRVNNTYNGSGGDLIIKQKTPLRVLHRRTLMTRDRAIHSVSINVVNAHWAVVDLVTSAGTYVKEFVHSDHGRTTPSLGSLLESTCDIIQLDVTNIEMDF
eukprot:PhM_4_TR16705/c0_g1_i1/m.87094/K07583/PUS10; tRNA pseudouridine synthase 10